MTLKRYLLAGIAVVSLGSILFWWLQPPSQLAVRVAMIESFLAEETSARSRIEQRLRELEEQFSVVAYINRAPGPETKQVAAVTFESPLSPSVPPSLENRHTDKVQIQSDKLHRNLRDNLLQAGIDAGTAEQILLRVGENRMELLSMRNKAAREGWIDTVEYMDALETLAEPPTEIRTEFGDDVYDLYLYAADKPNRVLITDVYPNSAAANIGIQRGDIILRYASAAIFSMRDLKQATVSGVDREPVSVEWEHNGMYLNATVQRGPLGVEMEDVQYVPEEL